MAKKILVCDDEKGFTSMLQLNLEAAKGYEVRVVNNPLKIVSTALQFKPDVILLDVIMPEKGGPDVANDIRSTEIIQHTPIIFLTATADNEDGQKEQQMINGHPFVAKPSNLDDLIDAIEKNTIPV